LPWLEDLAWARWAHEQGYAISYVAETEVIHVHNETWPGVYNRYYREGMAFKHIFPQEIFRLSVLVRLYVSNVASDLRAARKQSMLWRKRGDILRFRWMQFLETYQGYRRSGPLTWKLKQAFYYPCADLNETANRPVRTVDPIPYHDVKPHKNPDKTSSS
jgi:rhamnosyltransferase